MKLNTYIHLVPRLRMSGAVPLLPLFALMAWIGTTLSLPLKSLSTIMLKLYSRDIIDLLLE
jgi:hypothetical protein